MAAFFKLPRRATGTLRAALLATMLLLTGCASLSGPELPPPAPIGWPSIWNILMM